MEPLKNLKARLEIKDDTQDGLLKALLSDAKDEILMYTRRGADEWLPFFNGFQVKLAIAAYNRLGNEGMASRAEGQINTHWEVSGALLTPLNPYRRVRGLGV